MSSSDPISEEDLLAFVDGEMDAATSEAISTHLAYFPQDAALVKDWRHQNELIRASFARVEHEPVPLSLSLKPPRNPRAKSFLRLVSSAGEDVNLTQSSTSRGDLLKLGFAVLLAFGSGVVAAILTPHVTSRVSAFFNDIAPASKELSITQQAMEQALLTSDTSDAANTGVPLRLSGQDLAALGLTIRGINAGSATQSHGPCLLLSKDRQPLTLCIEDIRGMAPHQASDFKMATAQSTHSAAVNSISWAENGVRLALAGRLTEAELLDLARQISKRGEKAAAP